MNPSERLTLGAIAEEYGMTIAEYLRRRIFGYQMPASRSLKNSNVYAKLSQAVVALRGVSNNLNQLTRLLHSGIQFDLTKVNTEAQNLASEIDRFRLVLVEFSADFEGTDWAPPEDQEVG